MKKYTILFCAFFFGSVYAQKTYHKIISLPHEEVDARIKSVTNTLDGGYAFVGGSSWTTVNTLNNYTMIGKVDAVGNLQWLKHQISLSSAVGCFQKKDSGFIIASSSTTQISISSLDKFGNALWTKLLYFDQLVWVLIYSLVPTSDSSFLVVGSGFYEFGADSKRKGFVAKVDNNGNVMWAKTIGTSYDDRFYSIIENKDSGYIIAGTTYDNTGTLYGNIVVKINKDGAIQWAKRIGWENHYNFDAGEIINTKDGGFAITGAIDDAVLAHTDGYILKLDSNLNVEWGRSIGGNNIDGFGCVMETDDICYVLAGSYYNSGGYVVKFNNTGKLVWTKIVSKKSFYLSGITQARDHSYILVGANEAVSTGPFGHIVKMDSSGYVCGDVDSGGNLKNRSPLTILLSVKDSSLTYTETEITTPFIDHARFEIVCEDGVLALRLLSFSAYYKNYENIINWKTQQELNTKNFEIQRSSDATNFYTIGIVTAKNNSSNEYTYTDHNPLPLINYYRLKIIDNSGNITYSEIKTLKNERSFIITIYPNPIKGNTATIKINNSSSVAIYFSVINMQGKILISKQVAGIAGSSSTTIDVTMLPKGVYYLKVTNGKEERVTKFARG